MKKIARFVSLLLIITLLIGGLNLKFGTVEAQSTEEPDLDQIEASWPVVFEDTFDQPAANWDAPSGNYMNYEYTGGRFAAKDTYASSKARIKEKSWSTFMLTFNLNIPDVSAAGAFARVDLGDAGSTAYDSLLIKQNKISFYKSGVTGETTLANYTIQSGVSYAFRVLVSGTKATVEVKPATAATYQALGEYENLSAASARTVTFGHNLAKPSLDDVRIFSEENDGSLIPDVNQVTASWPVVFEDLFVNPTAKWDTPAGNYMNYQYLDGRFTAKDTFSTSKARIKGKSWKKFLLTFQLTIPDVSAAGAFARVDLGDVNSANYDSLLIKQNKISFYKSGITGETKIADYTIVSGESYDFRLLVDGNSAIVQVKEAGETEYETMGQYQGLYNAVKRTVTFGHHLLKPSLDNVRVYALAADNPYTGPVLSSLQFHKTAMDLKVGETENLRAIYEPATVVLDDDSVIWSSSNEQVVKLTGSTSKARAVTAVAPGTATIQAVTADNNITVICYVTVTPAVIPASGSATFAFNGAMQEIPEDLYGINYQKLNDLGRTDQWYSSRDIALMQDIGVDILRVPDGTSANYYLYKDGSLVNANDPRFSGITTGFEYTSVNGINNGLNGIFMDDIFRSPNELELPSTFVVNVAYQTVQEITEQVEEIQSLSDQPVRIEMGNEFYLNHYGDEFPSVTDYVAKAALVYAAIKGIDPNIKVGIVILDKWQETIIVKDPDSHKPNDPLDLEDTANNRYVRWEEWNRTIADHPDIYDAVVPHEYTGVHSIDDLTQSDFMDFLYVNNENRYQLIKEQALEFPGKEMWITEYGGISGLIFGGETNTTEKGRIHLGKTPAYSMHYMERFMNFMKSGNVQVSAYHCLIDNQFFGVVQDSFDSANKTGMVVLPPYYTFREIGKLLSENDYYYDMDMTSGDFRMMNNASPANYVYGKDLKINDVGAWGLGDATSAGTVVFSNRTNKEIEVSIPGQNLMPVWTYGGDPVPDYLVNDYTIWRQEPKTNPLPVIPSEGFAATVTLQPYSMTVVKLDGKTYSDVNAAHWAKEYIENLATKGLVSGGSATHYLPEANVTKANFTTMLVKALQISADYSDTPAAFADIASTDANYPAMAAAAWKGIATADSSGHFNPSQLLTIAEMIAMTQNAAAAIGKEPTLITNPGFGGTPSSTGYATRAEAARMVYALLALN
ncbi:S-layer homology domain-containing protein [Paenibacillus paridis]|uniref:S-layer homology domain-containing protein n=1 Tax=Paenibacillus paridis TaxID=2583376 RepID=UPI00111EFD2B|nr:S-layer homology domain-containing protein [Paenibacillus paridis]